MVLLSGQGEPGLVRRIQMLRDERRPYTARLELCPDSQRTESTLSAAADVALDEPPLIEQALRLELIERLSYIVRRVATKR